MKCLFLKQASKSKMFFILITYKESIHCSSNSDNRIILLVKQLSYVLNKYIKNCLLSLELFSLFCYVLLMQFMPFDVTYFAFYLSCFCLIHYVKTIVLRNEDYRCNTTTSNSVGFIILHEFLSFF